MDTAELDRLLKDSLGDLALRTAERRVLADWVTLNASDDSDRAIARSRAFVHAREALSPEALPVLEWLEEVIKVLSRPVATPAPPTESAYAFFSPGTSCIQEVLRQFNNARKSCDVCVFTITDNRITDAIIRAHQRRVKVRVITDDLKSHDLGSDIDQLREAGIACKMDVGQVAHMHHKFAVFDDCRLMTGSFNWTRSASEQNEENLIVTPDPTLVTAFEARFEKLWERLPG